jgi:Family of unknown function (DUF5906)
MRLLNAPAPMPGLIDRDHIDHAVAWLNSQHALIFDGSRTLIWTSSWDRALQRDVWHQCSVADFRLFYLAYTVAEGRRPRPLTEVWLSHPDARRYTDVVFEPGSAPETGVLNLWRGWNVDPEPGEWPRLKEHLYEIVASANETTYDYLLGWMARMIQHPSEPAGTAIVLRGAQGAGKGLLARSLGNFLGQHFIHLSHTGQLTNRFNSVLVNALLVFADEVVWAGDRAGEGALKALITEPTLAIERKGREVVTVKNMVHLLMATNSDWAAPVGIGDRRFCVVEVSDARVRDQPYFSALAQEQTNGGASAFLYDLLSYDLTGYHVSHLPPTIARRDQMTASFAPVDRWLHDCLASGQIGGSEWRQTEETKIDRQKLYDDYLSAMTKWREPRPANQAWLGRLLTKRLPGLRTSQQSVTGIRSYLLPPLPRARMAFERFAGNDLPWPSDTENEEK